MNILIGKKASLAVLGFLVPLLVVLLSSDSYPVMCGWSVAVEVLRYSDPSLARRARPEGFGEYSWIMLAVVDSCTWRPTEEVALRGTPEPGEVLMYLLRPITTVKGKPPEEPVWAKTGIVHFRNGMCMDTSADEHVVLGDSVLQADNSSRELRLSTCISARVEGGLLHQTPVMEAIRAYIASTRPSGHGAEGLIRGIVLDAEDDTVIPWANIVVLGSKLGAVTEEDGTFQLRVPAMEQVQIQVEGICFGKATFEVPRSGQVTPFLEIRLCRESGVIRVPPVDCPEAKGPCSPGFSLR